MLERRADGTAGCQRSPGATVVPAWHINPQGLLPISSNSPRLIQEVHGACSRDEGEHTRPVTGAQVFSVSSRQRGEAILLLLTFRDTQGVGEEEGTGEAAKISNWMPAGENS